MAGTISKKTEFIQIAGVFWIGFSVIFFVIGFQGSYNWFFSNYYHDDGSHNLYESTEYCLPGDEIWIPLNGVALGGYHDIEVNFILFNGKQVDNFDKSGISHNLITKDKIFANQKNQFETSNNVGKISFKVPSEDSLFSSSAKVDFDVWFYTPKADFEKGTFVMKKYKIVNSLNIRIGSATQAKLVHSYNYILFFVYLIISALLIFMSYKIVYKPK